MMETAYVDCFFHTSSVAEQFISRVGTAFSAEGPHPMENAPDKSRPVLVVVSERDDAPMNERTVEALLRIVNLFDGQVHDEGPIAGARPGGAPFANSLPQSVLDQPGEG